MGPRARYTLLRSLCSLIFPAGSNILLIYRRVSQIEGGGDGGEWRGRGGGWWEGREEGEGGYSGLNENQFGSLILFKRIANIL